MNWAIAKDATNKVLTDFKTIIQQNLLTNEEEAEMIFKTVFNLNK